MRQRRDALNAAAAQGQSQVQAEAEAMGRAMFAAQAADLSLPAQQFVTNLYEGFLQRGPDATGLSFWTTQAGTTVAARQAVLSSFATCPPARELAGTLYREAFWLVADQLGTPRMVVDKSGSLAGIRRHDYLPFGEEVGAGGGGRTIQQGYSVADGVRQKFTSKERDDETSLDYFLARYYSAAQGRFTSPDEFTGGPKELFFFAAKASANPTFYADLANPQSLNKYQYCLNNPLRYVDPDGHDVISYELLTSGPNQVPKTPHPEVPDVSTLGPKDTATGGFFVMNLKSNFGAGDRIEDYKPLRTAFILDGTGGAEVRSGSQENPSKSQTAINGQSRSVYDNPGIGVSGVPKASIGTGKVEMAFVAGEYNTKTKQLSSNMAYYKVTLVFKDGTVDTKLSTATMISRDDFIKLTGKKLPKDKKNKQPCPECSLQR